MDSSRAGDYHRRKKTDRAARSVAEIKMKERRSGVWGECLLLELRSSDPLLDDLLS
jgi:hypothetical protein